MTRKDIIQSLSKKLGIPQEKVREIVLAYEQEITDNLLQGINVLCRGFMSFEIKTSKPKTYLDRETQTQKIRPKFFYVKTSLSVNIKNALKNKKVY